MVAERASSPGAWYLEHLSERDLALLAEAARQSPELDVGLTGPVSPAELRSSPTLVEALLASQRAFELVFGGQVAGRHHDVGSAAAASEPRTTRGDPGDLLLDASPFLVFALALHRLLDELRRAPHVPEFAGPRRRVVVLGTKDLVEVLKEPWRRLYLAELLASFTHVASGSILVRTRRGLRRQRFSELDPVRLAGLLEVLPEAEHAGVYRRLGDLALFLTGVFPDHTARRGLGDLEQARLWRSVGAEPPERAPSGATPAGALDLLGSGGAVGILEELGARWYRLAAQRVVGPLVGTANVLAALSRRFAEARRVLNVLTDRYLLPRREELFGALG
jgi:hypothetical protein